ELVEGLGEVRWEDGAAEGVVVEDQRRSGLVLHQGGGEFGADESAADDRDAQVLTRQVPQAPVVGEVAEADDPLPLVQVDALRSPAGGEEQLVVAQAAKRRAHGLRLDVDLGRLGAETDSGSGRL